MRSIWETFFFPPHMCCTNCSSEKVENFGLCKNCMQKLSPLTGKRCRICLDRIETEAELCLACEKERPAFDGVFATYIYGDLLRQMIHRLKFKNKAYLKQGLAQMMFISLPEDIGTLCSCIVPVPIPRKRQRRREYNQAELLARELSRMTGLPVKKALTAKEGFRESAKQNKAERKSHTARFISGRPMNGERVLLVDDVVTTCTTVSECSRLLKKAGATAVWVSCAARTDKKI